MPATTPMMKQYLEIKEKYRDCILFFRLGDFYEMFNEDAHLASKELELTLTTRDRSVEDPEERTPMCGVPYHAADGYIARLVAKGYKVAICEQTEDPALAKGIVERDIIRVVTPGTIMETASLDEGRPNYLCAVYLSVDFAAACFADITTGEISVTQCAGNDISHIENEIAARAPAEAILNKSAIENARFAVFLRERIGSLVEDGDSRFIPETALAAFSAQFPKETGCSDAEIRATGALLHYITETQKTDISHISTLQRGGDGRGMELDLSTLRNLELVASLRTGEKRGSLLWTIDVTKTPMGRRLIRAWVLSPLLSPAEILKRRGAVEELFSGTILRGELIAALRGIGDLERLLGKVVYGSANCRDMKALSQSGACLPRIKELLFTCNSELLRSIGAMDELSDITQAVEACIDEDPPFSVREGGMVRAGYSEEVDRLRLLLNNSTQALAEIEARERARTGKKLKIGYNRVFGYYIEIPRSSSETVPDDYIRKQTLVNCERFITGELKNLEDELLSAKDKLSALEYDIITKLREFVASQVLRVQDSAQKIAALDVLCSLAAVAVDNNWCRPEIDVSGEIDIKNGRHPVVELMQKDRLFVANDARLDMKGARCLIITGPNMAGKSTFMREVALIVILAQIGAYVPAGAARIGIVDRVFTRIGASDDLSAGLSTFMVEMTEVADIIRNATARSLLILDEIGRGTSTFDGMSVARAVLEYCADRKKLGAKTLFATHYHELTEAEREIEGVRNFNITAKKRGDDIIFLRKVVPGAADDSYGIEVAKLAGVPDNVIKRAKEILSALENGEPAARAKPLPSRADNQISLLDIGANEISERLRAVDINTITPIEAMNLLYELKKIL